ncbi:MAG: phosphotransferase [Actinocatenispora sp.]
MHEYDTGSDAALIDQVRREFGIELAALSAATGGADTDATVWRATDVHGVSYALKLSHAGMTAGLPATTHLAGRGIPGAPSPLPTRSGRSCGTHRGAQLALTPWIVGDRGIDRRMEPDDWRCFGTVLAGVHAADPPEDPAGLPTERYEPASVPEARALDRRIRATPGPAGDDIIRSVSDRWRRAARDLGTVTDHAESLAEALRTRPGQHVLTHGDAHTGNVLVDGDRQVWLVDWDAATLAPRERDLMFLIGGVFADAPVTDEQRSWFFDGYGTVTPDPTLLAYYTCVRALEDVTGWASTALDPDRAHQRRRAHAIFLGLFTRYGIVERALTAVRGLPAG